MSHHGRHLKAAALARSERDGKTLMPVATIDFRSALTDRSVLLLRG